MTPRMRVCCETWANGPHTGACNRARRPVLYRPDGRSVTAPPADVVPADGESLVAVQPAEPPSYHRFHINPAYYAVVVVVGDTDRELAIARANQA